MQPIPILPIERYVEQLQQRNRRSIEGLHESTTGGLPGINSVMEFDYHHVLSHSNVFVPQVARASHPYCGLSTLLYFVRGIIDGGWPRTNIPPPLSGLHTDLRPLSTWKGDDLTSVSPFCPQCRHPTLSHSLFSVFQSFSTGLTDYGVVNTRYQLGVLMRLDISRNDSSDAKCQHQLVGKVLLRRL